MYWSCEVSYGWTETKTSSANDRENKGKKWRGPTHVNCENNQRTEHTIWQLDWECSSMEFVLQTGYENQMSFSDDLIFNIDIPMTE